MLSPFFTADLLDFNELIDEKAANKIKSALKMSPIEERDFKRINIRLVDSYETRVI